MNILGRRKIRTRDIIATIPDSKHIQNILRVCGLLEGSSRPVGIPSRPRDLDKRSPADERTASLFREGVGSAIYLSLDRRDIQYAVKELARRMSAPTETDLDALKMLGRYLLNPEMARLTVVTDADRNMYRTTGLPFIGFSDSDWAGCPEIRRSSGCVMVFIANSLVTISTQTQPGLPGTSSSDAEIREMSRCAREMLFVKQLAELDFEIPLELPPKLFADSAVGLQVSRKLGPGNKLRRLEVCEMFIQECVRRKYLVSVKCKGAQNPANFLTKHAPTPQSLQEALPSLGMLSVDSAFLSEVLSAIKKVEVNTFSRKPCDATHFSRKPCEATVPRKNPWRPPTSSAITAVQIAAIAAVIGQGKGEREYAEYDWQLVQRVGYPVITVPGFTTNRAIFGYLVILFAMYGVIRFIIDAVNCVCYCYRERQKPEITFTIVTATGKARFKSECHALRKATQTNVREHDVCWFCTQRLRAEWLDFKLKGE